MQRHRAPSKVTVGGFFRKPRIGKDVVLSDGPVLDNSYEYRVERLVLEDIRLLDGIKFTGRMLSFDLKVLKKACIVGQTDSVFYVEERVAKLLEPHLSKTDYV